MTTLLLIGFLGCFTETPAPVSSVEQPVEQPTAADRIGIHEGEQHPPIPANSPAWQHDPGGFVPDVRFYGERSWADVRMRVAGHLFIGTRDLARIHASQGEYAQASAAMSALLVQLQQIREKDTRTERGIVDQLIDATQGHIALYKALDTGDVLPSLPGLNGIRVQVLSAAIQGKLDAAQAKQLMTELAPHLTPDPQLGLSGFADFDDRHQLRARLWDAHLSSADPLGIAEPWGYFTANEVVRQANILRRVVARIGGLATPEDSLQGTTPELDAVSPIRWASAMGRQLWMADQQIRFSVPELGRLPTGDSLIDTAAEPGPMSIGRLEKMGLDDPDHRAWLTEHTFALNRALEADPTQVPPMIAAMVQTLDAAGHGSRYYNIKATRNSAVRVLARAGEPNLARAVLSKNLPLHHQDWECPNRAGILMLIDARLAAQAGDTVATRSRLKEATTSALGFLSQVDAAAKN